MAFVLVQNKADESAAGSTNGSVTLTSAATAGNLLVIAFWARLLDASITGPAGFTRWVVQDDGSATQCVSIWYKFAVGGEQALTFTHSSAQWAIEAFEFSGVAQIDFLDSTSQTDGGASVTSIQPGSITPVGTDELFITISGNNASNGGGEAINGSFTVIDAATFTRIVCGYKIKTDATAENPTLSWTTARPAICVMATFKPGLRIADYRETQSGGDGPWGTLPSGVTKLTDSVTWKAGDLVVVIGATEDSTRTLTTPTVTGLTFASIGTALTTGSNCWAHAWFAFAADDGSGQLSLTCSNTSTGFGAGVWVLRGHAGLGANARISDSALTLSLTKIDTKSIVLMGLFDWSASAAGKTGTPTVNVEREDSLIPVGRYSPWAADWILQATGATSYGQTTGGTANAKIVIEVRSAEFIGAPKIAQSIAAVHRASRW